jgi:regulator of sirC expression with transglutaminase-like and TPR domain
VEQPDGIAVPIVYTSTDDAPILFANQFVVQINQDEFLLLIGQLQPPLLLGTHEEQQEAAKQISHVSVRTVLRVAMTRTRVEELAGLLTQQLAQYDEKKGGSG